MKACQDESFLMRSGLRRRKDHIFLSLILIFIFILSFPKIGAPLYLGLDPSWEFAINYFFSKNIQHGRDVIFTYGPLGFLLCPKPIGNNLLISVIVITLFKFCFLLSFLYLNYLIKKPKTLSSKIGMLAVFTILSLLMQFGFILIFFTASLLLLHTETKNKMFIVLAIGVASFSLLVKSSFGIISILLVISYAAIDYVQSKEVRSLLFIPLGLAFIFVLEWFIFYRNLSGIMEYLYGTLQLSLGYSSAMGVTSATIRNIQDVYRETYGFLMSHTEDSWILMSIFFIIYFFLVFYIKDKKIFILYGMFLLPLFAFLKYVYTRGAYFYLFMFYIISFYCFMLTCLKDFKVRILMIVLISILILFVNMKYVRNEVRTSRNIFKDSIKGLQHFKAGVLNLKYHQNVLYETSKSNLVSRVLEKEILQLIGSHPVDQYPWKTTYAAANHLNWKPRPVFQSYTAYTPWLDQKNATFFKSSHAPRFLIWDVQNYFGEVSSIDTRYLLNDEPMAIYEIFNHYKLIYRDKKVALFERAHKNNFKEPHLLSYVKGHWDEWIKVPFAEQGVIRARIDISRKFIGSLKRLMYKEEEFFIEYKLEGGEIRKCRLIIDNAVSGVWINPFITKISAPLCGVKVKEVRFSHSRNDFIKKEIRIGWEVIETLDEGPFWSNENCNL